MCTTDITEFGSFFLLAVRLLIGKRIWCFFSTFETHPRIPPKHQGYCLLNSLQRYAMRQVWKKKTLRWILSWLAGVYTTYLKTCSFTWYKYTWRMFLRSLDTIHSPTESTEFLGVSVGFFAENSEFMMNVPTSRGFQKIITLAWSIQPFLSDLV